MDVCSKYIDKYVLKSDDVVSTLVTQTCELHNKAKVRYKCRYQQCDKDYVYHSGRVK